ncbi:MAG: AAA family ATPase [Chitinispirillales bacterium]|jgi:predicted ATPase|nr:AAA family ATPase [Chitinispirillales bacterium]
MGDALDKLTINGFKSIRELKDFELKNLNVLVGANGAGKSNLLSFFKMLHNLMDGNLAKYVIDNGGISDILYNGRQTTDKMNFEMFFGDHGYRFTINPTTEETPVLSNEARFYKYGKHEWWMFGDSNDESSLLVKHANGKTHDAIYSKYVYDKIMSWKVYHFHDTTPRAPMRWGTIVEDNETLRENASNIAPFLLRLREEHEAQYQDILNPFLTGLTRMISTNG